MSDARIGTGILLQAGDGATPEVFTTVAEIVSIKPPGFSRNQVDVSNHNQGKESTLLGILRASELTGKCNWVGDDPTHDGSTGMLADIMANTSRNWRITCPPNGYPRITGPGQLATFEPTEVPVDAALQFDFSIKFNDLAALVIEDEA